MSIIHPICGDCGLKVATGADIICSLFRIKVNPNSDSCSKYINENELKYCEICGSPLIESIIIDMVNENPHLLCTNCASQMNTCNTCKLSKTCDFETNPSPIEKTVNQQVRQGNMIMMTTVKNPKRIEETCKKNCKCYDEKNGCIRQINQTCNHWTTPY